MKNNLNNTTWKETIRQERNLEIFYEELHSFLPERILDFHVHVFQEGVVPKDEYFSNAGHPIAAYDLPELKRDLPAIYPGRKYLAVCFGFPELSYDLKANNEYLASQCDGKRFFPLRLLDPIMDYPDEVRSDLETKGFFGLKPYPKYARMSEAHMQIPDMLPHWAMEIVNDLEKIVMLHIPRKGRLADSLNQQQIVEYSRKYPKAKIVLAHIGRAYFLKNVLGNLDNLKDLPNVFFDLAMVNHWEVMEYLFQTVPQEKILFGTDIPIALAPGKSVEINDQYTYVTPVPWELSISDDHKKLVFTSFLYEELRAIKKAVGKLKLGDEFIQALFYENGMRLLIG